jgi:hypothetical protein
MRLMDRLHGLESAREAKRAKQLMCPLCGQSGLPAEAAEGSMASFGLRGEVDGHPVRRCFVCGAGFVVKGTNTEPIPALRWSEIEASYEERVRGDTRQ